MGAAERLREEVGAPLTPDETTQNQQKIAGARASVSNDAAFDAAWVEGRAMTMEEAVALALAR